MKKIIAAILTAGALCTAFTGCGSNSGSSAQESSANVDCAGKANEFLSAIDFTVGDKVLGDDSKKSLEEGQLKDMLGIDPADVSDFRAYIVASGTCPDQFGIFNAKDSDAANRVEEALKKRIEQQRKSFIDNGYTPDEKYKFDDSFVQVNGTVVSYAICADNSKAKEILG